MNCILDSLKLSSQLGQLQKVFCYVFLTLLMCRIHIFYKFNLPTSYVFFFLEIIFAVYSCNTYKDAVVNDQYHSVHEMNNPFQKYLSPKLIKTVFDSFFLCLADLTTPLVFSNHKSTHDVQKEVKEDLQDDRNILKQDDNGQ